jgi:hypothetical protein
MCSTRPLLPRRVMGGPEALSAPGPFWLHQRHASDRMARLPWATCGLMHRSKLESNCDVWQRGIY